MEVLSANTIDPDLTEHYLLAQLKTLSSELAQSSNSLNPSPEELERYRRLVSNLLKSFKSAEKDTQLLVCCSILDTLRIVVPVQILNAIQVKKIFSQVCEVCSFLQNPESQTYPQILHLLSLIVEISAFSLVTKHNHSGVSLRFVESLLEYVASNCDHTAEVLITSNIKSVLEELPEITDSFINPLLVSLIKKYKGHPRSRISASVLKKLNSPVKLYISSYLHELFLQSKSSKSSIINSEKYAIGYRVYKINHDYLISILCSITQLFNSKDFDLALKMIGKIASCKKSTLYQSNSHLFQEFLKQFEHKKDSIRLQMLGFTLKFCKNHMDNPELIKEIKKLAINRLRDSAANVRKAAIKNICKSLQYIDISESVILKLCERIRDIKRTIRLAALEELAKAYYFKCVEKYLFTGVKVEGYSVIIDEIVKYFRNAEPEEQAAVVNVLEEFAIPFLDTEKRAKALCCVFEDLSDTSKHIFAVILKAKSFWGDALVKTIQSENFEEASEVFCGNLKESMQKFVIKPSARQDSPVYSAVFKIPEVQEILLVLCSTTEYSEKCLAYEKLKGILTKYSDETRKAFSHLKARCFNFLICSDQIEYLTDNYSLISIIGQVYPTLVAPYLQSSINRLIETPQKKEILELLSNFELKNIPQYDIIKNQILKICSKEENLDTIKASVKVLKMMKPRLATHIWELASKDLAENSVRLSASIVILKGLIKSLPKLAEANNTITKDHLVTIIEGENTSPNQRCAAIALLKSLVKYLGLSPVDSFKYLRKLCFFLEQSKPDLYKLLSSSEESELRKVCLKCLISLLRVSEYKSLLDCKTLACLAQAALGTELQGSLGSILVSNIYERSILLPPLLSVLGLLLLGPDSKVYRDALVQVFKKMKNNSEEQQEIEMKLKLQPETYTPYLLFILVKCNLQLKACNLVIYSYLKCLHQSHAEINVNYLMYLTKQLKKFTVSGKSIKTEVYEVQDSGLDLERVCDEFSSALVQHYIPKEYSETPTKVLIPNAYFNKIRELRLSSPVNLEKKVDGTPRLRRPPTEELSISKQFKY